MAERERLPERTMVEEGERLDTVNLKGASNSDNYGRAVKLSHRQGPNASQTKTDHC